MTPVQVKQVAASLLPNVHETAEAITAAVYKKQGYPLDPRRLRGYGSLLAEVENQLNRAYIKAVEHADAAVLVNLFRNDREGRL